MVGWTTKLIKDVIVPSGTIDPGKSPDLPFQYVDVSSISNRTFEIVETTEILGKNAPSRARRRIKAGDVLFATIRPTLRRIAVVPEELEGQVCSTGYFVFRTKPEVNSRFLYYYLFSDYFMGAMEMLQTGASYPAVNDSQVRQQQISFPPLPEQKRIVAILDEAFAGIDAAVANTKKNLANARELFESYLNAVFTRKGEGWVEKKLETVSSILNGYAFKSTDFSTKAGVKCIKITNVGVRKFICDSDVYLPDSFSAKYDAVSVKEGSIVLALTRTIIAGGLKVAVVPAEYGGALLNQRVASIISNEVQLNGAFLFAYFSTQTVVDYVKERVNTLMQPNLSITDLRSMLIPVSPRYEQDKITEQLDVLREETQHLETIYKQKLAALAELKQSLLQKAFAGELTSPEKVLDEAFG
jgi:type I restriction enzyme S subunit